MKKLVDGIQQFQQDAFQSRRELFERLSHGQQPRTLFITCSDSRIDPNLLTQTEPGELFVIRNAGAIVPPYGAVLGGESATVEYAVNVLQVREIVVCGHSHCGAMQGLLHPETLGELPAVRSWLGHAEATSRIVRQKHGDLDDPAARLAATIEENVLVQLDNLRTHPAVAAALRGDRVELHGWVYRFETGEVFAFDSEQGRFLSVKDAADRLKS